MRSASSRSARSLIPRSIFRSKTREAGSIGIIPILSLNLGSRKRFRLISRVLSSRGSSRKLQTQFPSLDRNENTLSRSMRSNRI
jgi:hypothetical protein